MDVTERTAYNPSGLHESKTAQHPRWKQLIVPYSRRIELPVFKSRAAMYRAVLQHLRLLPDPMVWMWVIPRMRELCAWKPASKQNGGSNKRGALNAQELEKRKAREEVLRKRTMDKANKVSRRCPNLLPVLSDM